MYWSHSEHERMRYSLMKGSDLTEHRRGAGVLDASGSPVLLVTPELVAT